MIYTGQYGLKALGWLSLSKLCTTAEIWNRWSQATLPWVHNLSVWLLLASIPSWKFSETFNDVLQWMLTHLFNEENSATSGMPRWQKFDQEFVLLTMSLQKISETRSERKKAWSQIGWLKFHLLVEAAWLEHSHIRQTHLVTTGRVPSDQISRYYCTFAITDPSVGICWIGY